MFSFLISRQFLQNCKPSLFPILTQRFLSLKIAKHGKPIKQTPQKLRHKPSAKKRIKEPKIYASEKVTKIYNILKYSTWESAEEQLSNLPIKWESFIVNQVLKAHPPMEKAWLFFNWASGRKNFKHDQYTYTTMLDIFGEAGRISSMKYVFGQMQEKGVKIDVVTYTSLMHWMSKDGDIDGAIELWEEMRGKGFGPTVVTYTAYMKILFDHKRVNEASAMYKEMLESGLLPNCHTYTVLMDYLASSGKTGEALKIFSQMQEARVQPDKATCNILVEIFSRTGEVWAMTKILEYMKENFLVLRYPIYRKALEAFKIAGESDVLLRQVNRHFSEEQSDQDNDESDAKSPDNYLDMEDRVLLYLISKRNLSAVDSLLSDMINNGVHVDSSVISEIIEANCNRGQKNSALLAYEYSMKLGIDIDKNAYLVLLGSFMRMNSFRNVVEIFENMVKRGLSIGTHFNSSLIYRLGCCKEVGLASKVFNMLPEEDRMSGEYTALISAYFSSNNAEAGVEVFEMMKHKGVDIARGTYFVLLGGLEKCGKIHELKYYRKERRMMDDEGSPSRNGFLEQRICDLLFTGEFMSNCVG